ncbi:MAG: HlyD family secretion protein [Ignavibacteriaceae bacterium]|nr:HlyD family secretion protein [Ignavibacteriaceae bacterium]
MEENKEKEIQNKDQGNNKSNGSQNFYKQKRFIIPLIIFIVLGVFAWKWYESRLGYVSTDDAFIDADKLNVSAKMLGRITSLNFDEGDTVKTGQVILTLDSTDLIAQREESSASLSSAKESTTLAKVTLAKAQDDFDRSESQYNSKVIPKEQFDNAKHALNEAKARYVIAKSLIRTSAARLEVIKTQLDNTVIISPMNGVVGKRWVLTGDIVQPGQPIYTMFDLKNVWVTADLEETKLAEIRKGDKVEISVDAYPDQNFAGEVYLIGSNTASQFSLIPPANASGNFTKVTQRVPVKISIYPVDETGKPVNNKNIKLLSGMSVEIKVKIQE